MQKAPDIIAWGALAALCYAYFGYPILLNLLLLVRRPAAAAPAEWQPHVTVVLAAWNEAREIEGKIENTLAQSYPGDRLDLVVVSDGSTDGTDEIVESFARTGRVRLLRTSGRQGKSVALNLGVAAAAGEVLVFTDANAEFAPDAVGQLVGSLADPRVGAVSGQLHYRTQGGLDEGEGAYWRYEQHVKHLESDLLSLLGANGSIYAIRRELYHPVKAWEVNDFRIPYEALLRGYAAVLQPQAVSYEASAPSLWGEYRRKVRIMARAIPTMLSLIWPTLARGKLVLLWQLISHKVLREVQAVFFAAMLVGAAWGALLGKGLLAFFLVGQLGLYLLGALAWVAPATVRLRPLRLAAHFDMIVLASFAAFFLWVTRRAKPTWQPLRPAS